MLEVCDTRIGNRRTTTYLGLEDALSEDLERTQKMVVRDLNQDFGEADRGSIWFFGQMYGRFVPCSMGTNSDRSTNTR